MDRMDTIARIPLGSFVHTRSGWFRLDAIAADPFPGQPARIRLDLADPDTLEPDLDWLPGPGAILHYEPATP